MCRNIEKQGFSSLSGRHTDCACYFELLNGIALNPRQGELMSAGSESWNLAVLQWLEHTPDGLSLDEIQAEIGTADFSQLESTIDVLAERLDSFAPDPIRLQVLMQHIAVRTLTLSISDEWDAGSSVATQSLARLYEQLLEVAPRAAPHALQILAAQADEESITCLASLLVDTPPDQWQTVGVGLSPLWNARSDLLELFFDRIDAGFLHPALLAVLLDLANYSFRSGRLGSHPWQARPSELAHLLSSLVHQLHKLEREPSSFGKTVEEVQRVLADSVALTISLCDALGLIGSLDAMEALNAALALSHRRIQTEAAGALARIGSEDGRKRLVELAADRVARLRAVAYADELGFGSEIEESLRVPQSLAESELAAWLSSPEQYGIPPNSMELIDARTQFWPGYEEPQDCFLFRFTYLFPTGSVSQIGIAGPIAHAFHALPAHMPTDDVYAAFAGWQAEHEEIFEVPMTQLNTAQRREADRLLDSLQQRELQVTKSLALTFFFGEISLLAEAEFAGKNLCVISDGHELLNYPIYGESVVSETVLNGSVDDPEQQPHAANSSESASSRLAALSALLLCVFRGRKLLRIFNPNTNE